MNLSRTELGKFAQDFLNRPSSSVVLHDGSEGKSTPFNDGTSSLHVRALFNVRMLSDRGNCLSSHKNLRSLIGYSWLSGDALLSSLWRA